MNFLIVIAGPTASGKTQIALQVAKFFSTEILSADSRQFYREMNIGIAKPSHNELKQIPHHFINNLSVSENYNAGRFEKEALKVLNRLFKHHEIAVLAGGSGLYLHAVIHGFDHLPPRDDQVRASIHQDVEKHGKEFLLNELAVKDPEFFKIIDQENMRRLFRAIEVIRMTGKPYSSLRNKKPEARPFRSIRIALDPGRSELYKNINLRVDDMIEQGLEQEVKELIKFRNLPALDTVGYREFFDYFDQKISKDEAINLIKRNTRRYAKRQYTWFRKDKDFTWFHPDQWEEIIAFIQQNIN